MANKIIDSLTYGSDSYTFSTPYGTCATSAATAAKVVTCANFLVLEAGARVAVKFTYANSASAPTLNVNGTGAKTIKCTGFTLTNMWAAGSVIDFIYDGTNWCVAGYNVDTNTDTNTDTKVTSAANHYAPAEDTSALLSVDASSTTAATWNSTSLVTGVNIKRDAKGHVTGVTVDSVKMPANPDTNTDTKVTSASNHYTPTADASAALAVDASSSTAATWNSTSLVTGVNLQRDAKGHVTGVTVDSIKMPANPAANAYPKVTYEWNKEYAAGGTAGYLLIGSFPMYDSNVTIDIDATTSTTYHGTVIIATQNVSTTSIGSAHKIVVYGDPAGAISSAIRVVWTSGSNHYKVYFVPLTWSKNLIHIRAMALPSAPDESKICTFTAGTAPNTTSGLTVENALSDHFVRPETVDQSIEELERSLLDGNLVVHSASWADSAGSADRASKLSTARTISLAGFTLGSATFNGSSNCNIVTSPGPYFNALMTQATCLANGAKVTNTYSSTPPFLVSQTSSNANVNVQAGHFLDPTNLPGMDFDDSWYSDNAYGSQCSAAEADYYIENTSPYTITIYFYLKGQWEKNGAYDWGKSSRIIKTISSGGVASGSVDIDAPFDGATLCLRSPVLEIEAFGYDTSI